MTATGAGSANIRTPYGMTIYDFIANATPSLDSRLIPKLQSMGVGRVRYQLPWAAVEPTTAGTYVWGSLDSAVQACNTAGMAVTLTFQGRNDALYPAHQTTPDGTYKIQDPTAFSNYAAVVAARYNGLANSHGYVDSFELNEEFDATDNGALSGQSNQAVIDRIPDYFINVARKLYPAVKAVHPTCKMGSPAIWWVVSTHATSWMSGIYAAQIAQYIDYWSLHWYPQESASTGTVSPLSWVYTALSGKNLPTLPQFVAEMYSAMQTYHDLKPIRITEMGWLLNNQLHAGSTNSVVTQDTQSRNYYFLYNFSRKSGLVHGVDPWTIDYGTQTGAWNGGPSDGYSLVLATSGTNIPDSATVAQITAMTASYPSWANNHGKLDTFVDGDMFVYEPNSAGAARNASATSFGTESNGSAWAHPAGSGTQGFIVTANNGVGQVTSSGGTVDYFTLGTNTDNNPEIELRASLTNAADSVGILARVTGTNLATLNAYYLKFDLGHIAIVKVINGVQTVLATTTATYTSGTKYRLKFNLIGSSLAGKIWADATTEPTAWTVTVTDGSVTGIGKIGIAAQSASAAVQFDSFWGMTADAGYTIAPSRLNRFDGATTPGQYQGGYHA